MTDLPPSPEERRSLAAANKFMADHSEYAGKLAGISFFCEEVVFPDGVKFSVYQKEAIKTYLKRKGGGKSKLAKREDCSVSGVTEAFDAREEKASFNFLIEICDEGVAKVYINGIPLKGRYSQLSIEQRKVSRKDVFRHSKHPLGTDITIRLTGQFFCPMGGPR